MTKSEIFTKAHAIARKTVSTVGDYIIAFRLALKSVYTSMENTEQKLVDAGLYVWENYGKKRIYINGFADMMKAFPELSISFYKTGNVSSAYYKGEKISNGKAKKLIPAGKAFYDCISDEWVGITEYASELFGI